MTFKNQSRLPFALISLALFALVAGCSKASSAVQAKADTAEVEAVRSDLHYFKDKYGLCYAESGFYHSITTVPCKAVGL